MNELGDLDYNKIQDIYTEMLNGRAILKKDKSIYYIFYPTDPHEYDLCGHVVDHYECDLGGTAIDHFYMRYGVFKNDKQ